MEQDKFEKRLLELQVSFSEPNVSYGFRNEDDVWENIGAHPVDKLLTKIAELYIQSDHNQRQRLYMYCGTEPKILENA